MNYNSDNKMNKRKHCSKKIIPMVAPRLKHHRVDPYKVIDNSDEISNDIYNRLGDNALDKDVDNALVELILGCGIGEKKMYGFDCSKITSEHFNEMKASNNKKSNMLIPIVIVVVIIIAILVYLKYKK